MLLMEYVAFYCIHRAINLFYKGQRKGQGQDTDPDQNQKEGHQSLYY